MDSSSPACPPPPAAVRILRGTSLDADTISELVHELAAFEHLESECQITPATVERHLLGPLRSAEALVAWFDEAPVGFAVYYRTFSTFAARPGVYVEDLFVRPRYRHRGIGRALLNELGRIAHCAGAGRLEWTTLKSNENARRLYAAVGAKEMDDGLLLRMDAAALSTFACAGHAGQPAAGCRCGGKGAHHAARPNCNC